MNKRSYEETAAELDELATVPTDVDRWPVRPGEP
jgi:hypothetical protein